MTLYEYACDECKIKFDVTKAMKDSGRKENCPECKKEARRVFSSCNFVLAPGGVGWSRDGFSGNMQGLGA